MNNNNNNNNNNNKKKKKKKKKKSIWLDTTGWVGWFTGRCARNFYLIIWTNGICTAQHKNGSAILGPNTRLYNKQQQKENL